MTKKNKCSLLEILISRGDHIQVVNGLLVITPASKLDIPKKWLVENTGNLITEIAELFKLDVYIFDSYSTGYYGKHKSAGVTLQFVNLTTGEQCHVTFNAELKRSRSTVKGEKGTSLPKGQFRIGKRYKFHEFWLSTGLKLPPRFSAFHDYMGNLKQLYFVPSVDTKSKVINKIIPLLNIEHSEVFKRLSNCVPYNCQPTDTQQPYNSHTNMPYSDIAQPIEFNGLAGDVTTRSNNYELSKQGSAVISNPLPSIYHIKKPYEQTTDEWLNDWEQA